MNKREAKNQVGEAIYNAKKSLESAQELMNSIIDEKLVETKVEYKDCQIQAIAPLLEATPSDGQEHIIEVACVHKKTTDGFTFNYHVKRYSHTFTHTGTR